MRIDNNFEKQLFCRIKVSHLYIRTQTFTKVIKKNYNAIEKTIGLGTLWNRLKTHECGCHIPNIRITYRL